MQTDRLSEARTAAQRAVDLEPTASNYSVLGAVCARTGDSDAALAAIETAMNMEPNNAKYTQLYEQIQRNR
jgi:Flp pilus assembly protein TadD